MRNLFITTLLVTALASPMVVADEEMAAATETVATSQDAKPVEGAAQEPAKKAKKAKRAKKRKQRKHSHSHSSQGGETAAEKKIDTETELTNR